MVNDGFQDTRIIPIDRPPLDGRIREWTGESRGHWDGNTLVVETTNINDRQDGGPIASSHHPDSSGTLEERARRYYFGSGLTAHITERFTRVLPNRIEYQYTLNDPSVYVKPYTMLRPLERADDFLMLESACHEGNYQMFGVLSGTRHGHEAEAKEAAQVEQLQRKADREILRKQNGRP
jgi:hypothetical protein